MEAIISDNFHIGSIIAPDLKYTKASHRKPGTVVHTCNPRDSENWGSRIPNSRPTSAT